MFNINSTPAGFLKILHKIFGELADYGGRLGEWSNALQYFISTNRKKDLLQSIIATAAKLNEKKEQSQSQIKPQPKSSNFYDLLHSPVLNQIITEIISKRHKQRK
ncbi:MAG: hypothetical protein RLZ12_877 [Bacillota bacterium]